MTTPAPENLANALYNKLMPRQTGPFKIIEVSPTTLKIDDDGIQMTVSVDLDTLTSSAKHAEWQLV